MSDLQQKNAQEQNVTQNALKNIATHVQRVQETSRTQFAKVQTQNVQLEAHIVKRDRMHDIQHEAKEKWILSHQEHSFKLEREMHKLRNDFSMVTQQNARILAEMSDLRAKFHILSSNPQVPLHTPVQNPNPPIQTRSAHELSPERNIGLVAGVFTNPQSQPIHIPPMHSQRAPTPPHPVRFHHPEMFWS